MVIELIYLMLDLKYMKNKINIFQDEKQQFLLAQSHLVNLH